jgi:hypothetical protein
MDWPIGLAIQAEDASSFMAMPHSASEQLGAAQSAKKQNRLHTYPIRSIDPNMLTMN